MFAAIHDGVLRIDELALLLAGVAALILGIKDLVINRSVRDRRFRVDSGEAPVVRLKSQPHR